MKLNLKFLEISGTWQPNDAERRAAWDLYVELITRVTIVPIGQDEGLLREALTSIYSVFTSARDILKRYGPEVAEPKKNGQYNFAFLAIAILNYELRPILSRWHPQLEEWEAMRGVTVSRREHEAAWSQNTELRQELSRMRQAVMLYANTLGTACGVPNLSSAIPGE
ncbi:hypothetical protein [Streptomyces sp. NBC_00243]|uniref:hypothetical protein n=1 Tax=Streptomyces sp. NBC_00243 TaxID=2975688 RepID=UPI002DD9E8B9|nr:hypothetical protein [Streptomyces sp. NBC_00243]WRZ21396.1 hypothetical protein OHT59_24265 [Streptomyces sp. NBC_00243]